MVALNRRGLKWANGVRDGLNGLEEIEKNCLKLFYIEIYSQFQTMLYLHLESSSSFFISDTRLKFQANEEGIF